MRFAAVARVSDETWIACAVYDDINFGLLPGGKLDLNSTLCVEVRSSRTALFIDQASADARYRSHHTPRIYNIESYVSVPIVLSNGHYFGNLCAIDPAPANVSDPRVISMFNRFAQLIAQQLESDAARQQAQSALLDERAASELREQFIAILGHDLRNPLAAISASGEVLIRKLTDLDLLSIAARIKTNARRMSGLIDDVLDFARARLGGGIGLELQDSLNLEIKLAAVITELQDARPDRTITTTMRIGRPVRCDAGRVQQLVSNLVSNALTHGAAGTPVKFSATVDEGNLILEVWNDGEPIPADCRDQIFLPFWRHSTAATREGLGLGLHICAQIVRAHGGAIAVTSSRAKGTLFTASLPLEART
jgi:signal transduction histidine kinase